MKRKYYCVWIGKKTGIFTNWDECKNYVQGHPNAKYKAFPSYAEAKAALLTGWENYYSRSSPHQQGLNSSQSMVNSSETIYIENSISVDAACSGNPGPMEYQGVCTKTGKNIFHFGPITGTNNIGEFLAIVHGLALLKKQNNPMPIYSDSVNAIKWVHQKQAKTTLKRTADTEKTWQLIQRAELWLQSNSYSNPILKWETDKWGEIKADFGRK
ncbi:viroplasmin family protein [Bacillus kwashiorkori]|uniref:ribonuclease H1 domain-containing protein n=1 Tax=Bacillus kwashiorkori TaxID=1522318 RepID=UPI0007820D9E|nr:ribonuclease H family protein [Bacillus kwashiorkori]